MPALLLNILSAEISIDENSPYWSCTATVGDLDDFDSIDKGSFFDIQITDEVWTFIVESKKLDRSGPANASFTIVGRSSTCLLEPPFKVPLSYTLLTDRRAREVVDELLDFRPINWLLKDSFFNQLDWTLSKFSLAETNSSRISIAKKIVEAAGGVLECEPDGTFVARPLFSISPLQYDLIVPEHSFTEVENLIKISYDYTLESYYDYVRIRNTNNSEPSDTYEVVWNPEDQNLKGIIRIYPYPFRDINLETTSYLINLDYGSKQEGFNIEEDELITFTDGTASTKQPVYEIISVKWQDVSLQGIIFDQYTKNVYSTDPLMAYSLAVITYRTRFYSWNVHAPEAYEAQFLTVDPNV